mmetsp:Transcript_15374/g.17955  ORF Transcript_15374/g.17955 Transcript_15374/m.17955 type:complete len:207 (+) Transcript_15374:164-784(+)|eukprot:CAMPEP_0184032056 /NCGR_PEP_ID=MMETSP0955-20130417/2723_1 /TAXON_ID=627963 /ORGANISM="Aplanochytrium sp, Strain PBS07" /LENGTH=206 /DNA_ID=CAMNT_0026317981 /DNA_START=50 /DNA_END=670 /DNA_ORIENTATION=+
MVFKRTKSKGVAGSGDGNETLHVTYLCTSNVCRSPMAEYAARKMVEEGLFSKMVPEFNGKIEISSRGLTDGYSGWGSPANAKAKQVFAEDKYDIDMSQHQSRLLTNEHMERTDVLFVMTTDHIHWIRDCISTKVYEKNKHKLRTLGPNIPDPYFFNVQAYVDVAEMILKQVEDSMVAYLRGEPGTTKEDPSSRERENACYGNWQRG